MECIGHICEGQPRGMWREALMLGGHTESLMLRHVNGHQCDAVNIFGIYRCWNEDVSFVR